MLRLLFAIVFVAFLSGCATNPSTCVTLPSDFGIDVPEKWFSKKEVIVKPAKKWKKNGYPMPYEIGPVRWEIALAQPRGTTMKLDRPRYFYPSFSRVYVTPVRKDFWFRKFYPGYSASAEKLRDLLDETNPAALRLAPEGVRLPDEPWNDAGLALNAKFRVIESPTLRGYRRLGYYRQGKSGYGATNAELLYNFQGLTRDGRFYVSARIAIHNPALPDSIDDPRAYSDETLEAARAERQRVNAMPDDSFTPPIAALDAMMESIVVNRPPNKNSSQ